MSQIPSQPEEKTDLDPTQAASAAAPAQTGNLADTNSDEYKHKHGEHHHHHHHHHHRHHHFHLLNLSFSGIRDNIKLLFKTVYAYPYILLALSLVFLFIMNSGLVLSQLNAHQKSFSSPEIFYRWQEYLVMNKALLVRIPFQFTLVASVVIVSFMRHQQERHWQRNILKLLPAIGAAMIFSFSFGSGRPAEEFARSACRDCLRNYHIICIEYAELNNGEFPAELPDKPAAAARYGADHYVYHGRGKKANDEPFVLVEDKDVNHIGNCRYAVRSDGMLLVSKYGGLYEEYKGRQKP